MVTFVKGSSLPVSINDRAACQLAGGACAQLVVVEDIRQELIQPVWWGFSVAERAGGCTSVVYVRIRIRRNSVKETNRLDVPWIPDIMRHLALGQLKNNWQLS
jgi:hypothetical protein